MMPHVTVNSRITPAPVRSLTKTYERTPGRTTPAAGHRASFQTPGTTP
jgi:hypothetical protein